jgi:hypothetical protein
MVLILLMMTIISRSQFADETAPPDFAKCKAFKLGFANKQCLELPSGAFSESHGSEAPRLHGHPAGWLSGPTVVSLDHDHRANYDDIMIVTDSLRVNVTVRSHAGDL